MRGEGHLSEQELEFIGYTSSTRAPRDGWHDINVTMPTYELTAFETSTEDAQMIPILMTVGTRRDGIEFVSDGWY